jgi:hypothetical protein
MLLIAWIPALAEAGCSYIPHFEEHFPATILIIPYMEFIGMPLTFFACVTALYKAVKSGLRFLRRAEESNQNSKQPTTQP